MQWAIDRVMMLFMANDAIPEAEADIYRYGLDLLLSSIINILSILMLGIITHHFKATALMVLFYIPLQSFGGGYHANTHLMCYAITLSVMAASVCIAQYVPVSWLLSFSIPGIVVLFKLAPVEHENAPFSVSFAAKMKKVVRSISAIFLLTSFCIKESHPLVASCLAVSLIMSSMSLSAAHFKKKILAHRHKTT